MAAIPVDLFNHLEHLLGKDSPVIGILNKAYGLTNGTAAASSNLTVDANKDFSGVRRGTFTGTLGVAGGTVAAAVGMTVGTVATGVLFSGVTATVMSVQDVGTVTSHVIDMIDAYVGKVIETGTYASAASKGVTLSADNFRPVTLVFDDGGALLGAGNYRCVLSRMYVAETQTGQIALRAIRGQVKVATTKNLTIGTNEMNAVNAVEGYIELAGTHTIGANTRVAAVHGLVEVNDTITLTTGGKLVGLYAELSQVTAKTVSGIGTAGILVDRLDPDHSTNQAKWGTGLVIADSACTTGINIGVCATAITIAADCTTAAINITGGTSTGHAIVIGTSSTGIQVDGTPDYAIEAFVDVPTGAQSLANVGTQNNRLTIKAASDITSGSFLVASYNRIEIEGGDTSLGAPWIGAVLGYYKNPSGTVSATHTTACGLIGIMNVGANYVGGTSSIHTGCGVGSYGSGSAVIPYYYGFSVLDLGGKDFTHGLFVQSGSSTTVIGTSGATNLFSFPADGTAPVAAGNYEVHGGTKVRISVTVGGAQYYMLASTGPTTQS